MARARPWARSSRAPICWLALSPLTGRTHQLRVHCAALDFPIFGDPIYGAAGHGRCLASARPRDRIPLSKNKPEIEVEACAPDHMKERLAACGWTQRLDDAVVALRQKRELERENERESARTEAKVGEI